jgi:hypothetical protein
MINEDKFEKIKQDIEGSLIELVDEGYKVDVISSGITGLLVLLDKTEISVTIKVREVRRSVNHQDIGDIKEYIHHLYDLMEYHRFKLNHVNLQLLFQESKIPVRLLDSTGKFSLESDFYKAKNFESVWDSIDFCIFSSNRDVDKFFKIELIFKQSTLSL